MKKAFTLVEIILVIVILSIVAGMSLNMVFSIYKNYMQTESVERLSSQINLILNQISKRLDYRIRSSVIARKSSNGDFVSLSDTGLDSEHDVLEFIPYSYEAFNAGIYSGVSDMQISSHTAGLITPGSNLNKATNLFSELTKSGSRSKVNFSRNFDTALLFKGIAYNVENSFGYNGNISNLDVAPAKFKSNNSFELKTGFISKSISEQYHLAYTAYAISVVDNGTAGNNKDFDLYLHYNYRPWLGERYNDATTPKTLLAKNVSRFKFKGYNGIVLLKLCIRDNQKHKRSISKGSDIDFTLCRTKAVY